MKSEDHEGRGEQTRQALIAAAIEVFGHTGFDAASTRALARGAGVNQALIGYHFGGKRGLYQAVFAYITEQMRQQMAPVARDVAARLEQLPADGPGRQEGALQLLLTLLDVFIDMFTSEAATAWVPLVVREQQDPTEAFDMIYDQYMGPMLSLATHLVGAAADMDERSEACRVRTLMILGQVLVFQFARGTRSRYLPWGPVTADNITAMKAQLRLGVEAQLSGRGPAL